MGKYIYFILLLAPFIYWFCKAVKKDLEVSRKVQKRLEEIEDIEAEDQLEKYRALKNGKKNE